MQRFRQSFCATRKQPFLLTKRKIWFAFINAHASAHHLFSTTPVTMRFAQWFRLSPRCGYHQPTIQSFQNKCNIITVALVYIYILYSWYTPVYAGIRWYRCGIRAVYAHDPPAPKRREPPAVILSIGSERSSQVTWDMAQDRCSEVMN